MDPTHHFIEACSHRLHGLRWNPTGVPSQRTFVLLHGTFDHWRSWTAVAKLLSSLGHVVWTPDSRGANLSDRPETVSLNDLACDAMQWVSHARSADPDNAIVLVGHDMGGLATWQLAMQLSDALGLPPSSVEAFVVLGVMHPSQIRAAWRNPNQLARSWYAFAALRPEVERFVNPELIVSAWQPYLSTPMSVELRRAHVAALSQPGALSAQRSTYVDILGSDRPLEDRPVTPITHPCLVIQGADDTVIEPSFYWPPHAWVVNSWQRRLADAGHWPQLDQPERLTQLLHSFACERSSMPRQVEQRIGHRSHRART